MAITNDLFVRVNTQDARRAITWYDLSTSGESQTAATLTAFTAAMGGAASGYADVQVSSGEVKDDYDSVAELRQASNAAGLSVSATGTVSAYTPAASDLVKFRRNQLREILWNNITQVPGTSKPRREVFEQYVANTIEAAKIEANLSDDTRWAVLKRTAEAITARTLMRGNFTFAERTNTARVGGTSPDDPRRTWIGQASASGETDFFGITAVGINDWTMDTTATTMAAYDFKAGSGAEYYTSMGWVVNDD